MINKSNLDESILIVGTGTFGLSTALHLARRGYTDILAIDPYPVPSRLSAGNDISKVIRTQYRNPLYERLAHHSLAQWNIPPFNAAFERSGVMFLQHSDFPPSSQPARHSNGLVDKLKQTSSGIMVSSREDILAQVPLLESQGGSLEGLSGALDPAGGYAVAYQALVIAALECRKLGVRFQDGESATMKTFLRDPTGKVIGVEAQDGTTHFASKVIFCVGGWSESLLDFEGQLVSGYHPLVHYDLSQEEADEIRDMPVIAIETLGFIVPPNDDNILKMSDLEPLKTNYVDGVNIPDAKAYLSGRVRTLPKRDEEQSRIILKHLFPKLYAREPSYTRMCWDAHTYDDGWIIDAHPSSPSSLIIATGGSGHSFKNLPLLGEYVVDMMEGKLDPELKAAWRWRPEAVDREVARTYNPATDVPPPVRG